MKKTRLVICAVFVLITLLAGCSKLQPGTGNTKKHGENEKLQVYASVYPVADFARKIAGDRAEVLEILPAGAEPHDWEPSPKDIVALSKADLLLYNGAGLEHWVDTVLRSLNQTSLLAVETAQGVELLARQSGYHEAGTDPHVWLDPQRAKLQMQSICGAMCGADPLNAEYYSQNYIKWAAELDSLHAEYTAALSGMAQRDIVVAHEAFGYLCNAYGLTQVGAQGFSPEGEPNPAQMAALIDYARNHRIKIVFFEETASPKIAETIAREIGAETGILNPLESLTKEQRQAGEDYFSVMRQNLQMLVQALSE